jgi:peptidoglycan/xylan/chitin deacetylase (PgdA/CDA1 family)
MELLQISQKTSTLTKRITSFAAAMVFAAGIIIGNVPKVAAASLTAAPRVSFTFDDGMASAVNLAAPTLAKYGFAGNDYVITGCVGMTTAPNTCRADTGRSYMTWAQIAQLAAAGWEIGSHTVNHYCLASSGDGTDCQTNVLTPAEVDNELTTSKLTLGNNGYNATDFATPYGDWLPPVMAQIAKTYASHRGFGDSIDQGTTPDGVIDHGNTFPYNDYLLYDLPVQNTTTVAQIKSYIDQTRTNNQWLVISFHDIVPDTTTTLEQYQYKVGDLDQIAAYVKSLGMQVTTINNGLAGGANLLPNSSFDTAISSNINDTASWSTDSPAQIGQEVGGNHGNYPSPANSVHLTSTTKNVELFSPRVGVDPAKKYILKNYLNVLNMAVAAGHEIDFYIDEYDANGAYLGAGARFMKAEVGNAARPNGDWAENLNFEYTPTAGAKFARLQVVVTANSGANAYLDNVQWIDETGAAVPPGVGGGTLKPGDVNGDGLVNALDLSIMLSHWNQAGSRAQGDLSGDGRISALDLSMLLSNWNK